MARVGFSLSFLFDVGSFLVHPMVVIAQPVSGFLSEGLVLCLAVIQ